MSGGHFNDNGYIYHQVEDFACELEEAIKNNFVDDDWGYHTGFSPDIIEYLKLQVPKLRQMAEIMHHIDYLFSGDYGENTFAQRIMETEGTVSRTLEGGSPPFACGENAL